MQRHRWICSSVTPSVPSCQQRQNLNKRVTQRGKSSSDFLLIFDLGLRVSSSLSVSGLLSRFYPFFLSSVFPSVVCHLFFGLFSPSQCFFGLVPLLGLFLQTSRAWCRSASVNLTYSTLHSPPTRTLPALSLCFGGSSRNLQIFTHTSAH